MKLATVRLTRGYDIETACGQLAAAPRARVAAATYAGSRARNAGTRAAEKAGFRTTWSPWSAVPQQSAAPSLHGAAGGLKRPMKKARA
jgi:hypothetical protein